MRLLLPPRSIIIQNSLCPFSFPSCFENCTRQIYLKIVPTKLPIGVVKLPRTAFFVVYHSIWYIPPNLGTYIEHWRVRKASSVSSNTQVTNVPKKRSRAVRRHNYIVKRIYGCCYRSCELHMPRGWKAADPVRNVFIAKRKKDRWGGIYTNSGQYFISTTLLTQQQRSAYIRREIPLYIVQDFVRSPPRALRKICLIK